MKNEEDNQRYEDHKQRHVELHRALDELLGDFIMHTAKRPSETTVQELMGWAYEQTIAPCSAESHKSFLNPGPCQPGKSVVKATS